MLNRNEFANRKDLKVGKLVLTSEIYPWNGKEYNDLKKGDLVIGCSKKCRSILFETDHYNFARDLLYKSEHYPILGITAKEYLQGLDGEENYIISKHWNLEELLKFLGYKERINRKDLLDIRRELFDAHNQYHAFYLPSFVYYQYKECLEELRDKTLIEARFNIFKCDSFKPREELVRKLSK